MLRFDERVAVITGATQGLGRAYALLLAARGAKVVISCRQESDASRQVAQDIQDAGSEALVVPGDVGAAGTVEALVDAAMDTWGRIDIAISNAAGPLPPSRPHEDVAATVPGYVDVHVLATLRLNRAAWPHMQRQKYGRLLASSGAAGTGYIALPGGYFVDYPLVKAALFGVVRQTAAAGASDNIMCNMVLPWAYTKVVADHIGGTELGNWMEANVRSEQVAAAIAPLVHESCPTTGEGITAGGGRVGRVFFAATRGILDPDLTPESALERWDEVMGGTGPDGTLLDAFEQTQPREEAFMGATLAHGAFPHLAEIAAMPLKGQSKSMEAR